MLKIFTKPKGPKRIYNELHNLMVSPFTNFHRIKASYLQYCTHIHHLKVQCKYLSNCELKPQAME